MTYNGENNVSTFSQLFLIRSFLYLQVTRKCIKSGTSSNFSQIGPLTVELGSDYSLWSYLALNDENFTLSNLNISGASWPILIKFYVASLGVGKGCIMF